MSSTAMEPVVNRTAHPPEEWVQGPYITLHSEDRCCEVFHIPQGYRYRGFRQKAGGRVQRASLTIRFVEANSAEDIYRAIENEADRTAEAHLTANVVTVGSIEGGFRRTKIAKRRVSQSARFERAALVVYGRTKRNKMLRGRSLLQVDLEVCVQEIGSEEAPTPTEPSIAVASHLEEQIGRLDSQLERQRKETSHQLQTMRDTHAAQQESLERELKDMQTRYDENNERMKLAYQTLIQQKDEALLVENLNAEERRRLENEKRTLEEELNANLCEQSRQFERQLEDQREHHDKRERELSPTIDSLSQQHTKEASNLERLQLPGEQVLQGHTDYVQCCTVFANGTRALSGSKDNTLRLWDLTTGKCLHTLQGHTDWVACCAMFANGTRALSGSEDKTLRVWNLDTGKCLHTMQGHTKYVECCAVFASGTRALSGSRDTTLRVWDLTTGKCLHTLQGHTFHVMCCAVFASGTRALSGSWDNTLRVWDLTTGKCLHTLQGHTDRVWCCVVFANGTRALSSSVDKIMRVWDLTTGQCLHILQGHTGSVKCCAVFANGTRALSGSADNTLRVWDLTTGECLRILQGHTGSVKCCAVFANGTRALSGSADCTLRVWDLTTGECLRTRQGHTDWVACCAMFANGTRALSGSWDNTLRVWDLTAMTPSSSSVSSHSSYPSHSCNIL